MCPNCEKNDAQHSEVIAVMRKRSQEQSAQIKALKSRLASKSVEMCLECRNMLKEVTAEEYEAIRETVRANMREEIRNRRRVALKQKADEATQFQEGDSAADIAARLGWKVGTTGDAKGVPG